MSIWHERTLALAGILQAAVAVQQLARRGVVVPEQLSEALLDSVLTTDADSTEAVYGSPAALFPGLKVLQEQLNGQGQRDVEQTRYIVGMMQLERRLMRNNQVLNELSQGINQIKRQRDDFDFSAGQIRENLARLYTDTISQLGPRIQISGRPEHLQHQPTQHHIRSLLLAGIRSAVLWRQLGGKRRQIIFSRARLLSAARDLLAAS